MLFQDIVDSVELFDNFDNIIEVKYHTNCNNKTNENTKKCSKIRTGNIVDFSATIKLLECPKENFTRTYHIRPGTINETLTIELEMLCECPCERPNDPDFEQNSAECTNSGNLTCGVCDCNQGKFGERCECDSATTTNGNDNDNCIAKGSQEICSGLGSCKCGKCECRKRSNPSEIISGKFCQCNNFSCKKIDNYLCSGPEHGTCKCGKCECFAGWSGDGCDCSSKTDTCVPEDSQQVCSGRGECICGKCQCSYDGNTYAGKYCEECVSCPSHCEKFQDCVECKVFQKGKYDEFECNKRCADFSIDLAERLDFNMSNNENKCKLLVDKCTAEFKFSYNKKDLQIVVKKTLDCSSDVNVLGKYILIFYTRLFKA